MTKTEEQTANKGFAKAGVSCLYDSEVINSSFVHLMKFSAKNPRLRKPQNVGRQHIEPTVNKQNPEFLKKYCFFFRKLISLSKKLNGI